MQKIKILHLITVLTCFGLFSCQPIETKNENRNPPSQKSSDQSHLTNPEQSLDRIATGFGGHWVNKKYIDKLLQTKSPRASQESEQISMLILPDETNKQATIIWGFHDGTNGRVVKKDLIFGVETGVRGEIELTLALDNNLLKTNQDEFIKINDPEHIVEPFLVAGKYKTNDREVEFTVDGKVIGIDTISNYSVLIDYYDAGRQVDMMILGTNKSNGHQFGFEFIQNTLLIYKLDCVLMENGHCVVVENGKLLFEMTKE